jgi:hypothetical protein
MSLITFIATSCQSNRPSGVETSINILKGIYESNDIKQFNYQPDGYWITAELTEDALKSDKYVANFEAYKKKYKTDDLRNFRFYVKVISLEEFKKELSNENESSP